MNYSKLLNPILWISALLVVLFLVVNIRIVRSVSPNLKQRVTTAMVIGGALGVVGQSASLKEFTLLGSVAYLYAWVVAFIDNYKQGKENLSDKP
ncbi:MAG: hypothetical protein AB1426_09895 [Bacillota bacterium]